MVPNPIYSEPLYDKVGGPPKIAIPPVPPSASDTHSMNSSPLVGTPTPLLSTHYAHNGQKFIYEGKYMHMCMQSAFFVIDVRVCSSPCS